MSWNPDNFVLYMSNQSESKSIVIQEGDVQVKREYDVESDSYKINVRPKGRCVLVGNYNPNELVTAPNGSTFVDDNLKRTYRNTDGATRWIRLTES